MINVFLQARMNSERLPGKAFLDLGGMSVLEHAMRALNGVKAKNRVLVTCQNSLESFRPAARKAGWRIFSGAEENVLQRFEQAAQRFPCSWIVRATADNPLVSSHCANLALNMALESSSDYARFEGLPLGAGVEIIKHESLQIASKEAFEPYDKEHVTPYLYHHPQRFNLKIVQAPEAFFSPNIRLTIDFPEDYKYLRDIFDKLYEGKPIELDKILIHTKSENANVS